MQNNAIQVKGLQKSYKQLHVLKGVDLEVGKGSIFALFGSNGSGKTTIVKILPTLLKRIESAGEIGGHQEVIEKKWHLHRFVSA